MATCQIPQWMLELSFSERVARLRKERGLTQQQLAERVGVRVLQIRRYERGSSQPTLEVIKNMAVALGVTSDALIFDSGERGPADDFMLQFEALRDFTDEERKVAKELLESLILKHNARQSMARSG